MAELQIETPDGAERTVPLSDRSVSMGRADDCDVVLSEQKASRKHCRVEPRGDGWRVVDEGSSNGTWLGGKPVLAARLKSGDEIEIGETVITFADVGSEPPPPRRPKPKKKPTPWGALFIPVIAAAVAIAVASKFDKSEGADASASLKLYATAEIERAKLEKDPGKRTAKLNAARDKLEQMPRGGEGLELVKAEIGGPASKDPSDTAGEDKPKDDWHAAIDEFDADKAASPSQRRTKLVGLLDRHIDDAGAAAAIRDRFRAELTTSSQRVRLDREQTFADADQAAAEERYGTALTLWTSWIQRAPSISPEDDKAIAQRIADLLEKARAAAQLAADQFETARREGRAEAARSALDAAMERLRGSGFEVWLAARGGASGPRRPGSKTSPDKPDDPSSRERTRALQIAKAGEDMARSRRFDDAAAKLDEAAAVVADSALRREFAWRAADMRTESAFLTKLLGWIGADPKKFSPLKVGDHLVRVAGAGPAEVSLVDKDGSPEPHPVADLPSSWFTQLVEKAAPDKADYVGAALFLRDIFEQDGYVKWMRAALSVDELRAPASDVHARCIGRPTPLGGYMPHPKDVKSIVTHDEYDAIVNEAKIKELKADLVKKVEAIEKSHQAKAIEGVRRQYAKLEEARNYALALIFDDVKYFYPYRGTGREGEYAKVQHEVDERVKAVRDAWEDPTKAVVASDAAMDKLLADADKIVTDIRYFHGDLLYGDPQKDLGERIAKVTQYFPVTPPGTTSAGKRGRELTVQTFFETENDLAMLTYNDTIMLKYNLTVKGPTDPEREQVKITNEYRKMFGHRRAVRIHPFLVLSARGHSEDMTKLGFFDHFNKFNPEKYSPDMRMKLAGYIASEDSENIASVGGSPESAHEGWIHSSGHHRNILNPSWVEMGSGSAGRDWTQNFGFRSEDDWEGGIPK